MRGTSDLALALVWECERISREDVQALDAEARKLFGEWSLSQSWVSCVMADSRCVWDRYSPHPNSPMLRRSLHLTAHIKPQPGAETKALAMRDMLRPKSKDIQLNQLQCWLHNSHDFTFDVRVGRPQIVETIQGAPATQQ